MPIPGAFPVSVAVPFYLDRPGRFLLKNHNFVFNERHGWEPLICKPVRMGYFMKWLAMVSFLVLLSMAHSFASEPAIRTIDCGTSECPKGQGLTQKVEGDALVKKFCTTCHTEGRIMESLKALRREQQEDFAKSVKSIIVKKIRLTGGKISHQDGKKILEYLNTL